MKTTLMKEKLDKMENRLNGFNNGRDTTDGIGGKRYYNLQNKVIMKCKIKDIKILEQLNHPQWMPGEGYADTLRGNYREVMECKYVEELVGSVKCPTYYLIGEDGTESCTWAGSVFERDWELIYNHKEAEM